MPTISSLSVFSIAIPRLSEVLSELVWRVVGGELSVDLAISYLASDKPFQARLRAREEESGGGEGEEGGAKGGVSEEKEAGTEDSQAAAEPLPLQEALCDTIWGVDVMVSRPPQRLRKLCRRHDL